MQGPATTQRSNPDEICGRTAARQAGLLTLAQALAAGLNEKAIAWRIQTGRWYRVLPTVYCINGAPKSRGQQIVAAYLWCGEGSAVSHGAAASIWGLHGFKSPEIEVSTTRAVRPNGLPLRVHRVDDLLIPEIVPGMPAVTSVRRTLLDIAGSKHHRRTESCLDQGLREDLVTPGQIWLMLEDPRIWGRRGVGRLRTLMILRTPGKAPTDSDLELLGVRVLVEGGLPPPVQQFPLQLLDGRVIHPDLSYPEATLAIECDSYGYHMDREAFERDRLRDHDIVRIGWKVLRFTWAMLKWQSDYVIETVRWHRDQRLLS